MRVNDPRVRRPARRWAGALALALLAIIAAAAAFAWWWLPRPPAPLEAGWKASVTTLAGDGIAGSVDGPGDRARFTDPFGIASAPDGALHVVDAGETPRIRRIAADGTVSTLAGGPRGYADGPSGIARFDAPSGIAVAPDGTTYVADTGNHAIRRITPDGVVSTIAGGGGAGYQDGISREARFNGPVGVAVDRAGRVIVADTYNDRIRAIEPDGRVVTIAGSGVPGALDGVPAAAQFDTPSGVAVDREGNIYVADTGNGAVRLLSPSGFVSTLALLPDGGLRRPTGIAASPAGDVYVTDDRGRLIEIAQGGQARTVAGSDPGFEDGEEARFRGLAGVAFVAPGRVVVTDPRNALVRLVAAVAHSPVRPPSSPLIEPRFERELASWKPLLWPFAPMDGPFEITGTLGEPRGGDGQPRLHAGLDIYSPEGTIVRAVRPGVVTSPAAGDAFGTLNESVRVGPLTYVHLRVGRDHRGGIFDDPRFVPSYDIDGRLVRVRVRRGARFETGDPIGTVNGFYHAHLNVGWPGEERNPLAWPLVRFEDRVPPRIARNGVRLFREDQTAITDRRRGRLVVNGRVFIVVDAWDQVDGNLARRRLGLYRLGYQVLDAAGSVVPGFGGSRETIRFDRMPRGDEGARMVYASGSGIPFYGGRTTRFLYVVTNTLRDGVATPGMWDTTTLAPGDYTLRILAADINGNEAVANRDLRVTVEPGHR